MNLIESTKLVSINVLHYVLHVRMKNKKNNYVYEIHTVSNLKTSSNVLLFFIFIISFCFWFLFFFLEIIFYVNLNVNVEKSHLTNIESWWIHIVFLGKWIGIRIRNSEIRANSSRKTFVWKPCPISLKTSFLNYLTIPLVPSAR